MDESKSFLLSKTFWGLVVSVAAMVCKQYGIEIDQAGIANDALGFVGAAFALYGRFVAAKDLHIIKPKGGA